MSEEKREVANGFDLIYEVSFLHIWDVAKDKIRSLRLKPSFDDGGSNFELPNDKTIALGLKVIDLLRDFKIMPSRIVNDNDGNLSIGFHTWDRGYDIEIESPDITFIKDKKHCFYRKNSKGIVDCEHEIFECSIDDLEKHLSEIKKDKFDDLVNLIKMIGDFSENWHINYRKSKRFNRVIIKRSLDMLNFLGNRVIKPTGIFPVVTDMDGNVAIRICFKIGKSYMFDINEEYNVLKFGDLFELTKDEICLTIEETEEAMTRMLLGKMVLLVDEEADKCADRYFSDRYKKAKKRVIRKKD
jgi:hypothetical protein